MKYNVDGSSSSITMVCFLDIIVNGVTYLLVPFLLLKDFEDFMALGQDFIQRHRSLTIEYGGDEPEVVLTFSGT